MGHSLEVGKWMAWLTSPASAPSPFLSLDFLLGSGWCGVRLAGPAWCEKGGRGRKLGKWKVTTVEGERGEEEGGHKFGGGGGSKWGSKLGEWVSAQLPPSTPVRRRRFRIFIKPGKFVVLDLGNTEAFLTKISKTWCSSIIL